MTILKRLAAPGKFLLFMAVFGALTFDAAAQIRHGNDSFQAAVIAPDAPETVKYAAQDWRKYVRKVTGTDTKLCTDGKLQEGPAVYIGESEAAAKLVEKLGGEVVKIIFVMELAGLEGRKKLGKYDVESLIVYEGK